ncbi:AsmA family protein [Duganella sp. FT80W]|uniref:AsmA family protein n=1 Tax=Duganella guangzhouensis TaxID=2666084 RepID=A0A6I2L7N1_9BURK|nr:AsmA family protein [Duganella guangzhouensis]MRW94245.1 AsmA family protein [Duganella guangzhouensis]
MPLPRRTRIALAVSSAVLAMPVIAVVALSNYDWNRARPWLNQRISSAIDRPFEIRGDVSLTWQRQGSGDHDRTWRDYLPLPHLLARDVHVGNPRGMQAPSEMVSVSQFAFAIEPLPLLRQRIEIPVLRFDNPALLLQRDADGKNNWTFKSDDQPSAWKLDVQQVVFAKGTVRYIDAMTHVDAAAQVDTVNDGPYGVAWQLRGKWNQQDVSGSGKAGAVLSLQSQTAPYPLAASLNVGGTNISVEGTLTKPAALAALDMRLKLSGPSMARLYGLTGVLLPETPPFTTEGHLSGNLGANASHWIYDQFTGKVGQSDIGGKLEFRTGAPRPLLSGTVQSKLLQVSDLGPLIGADSNASKEARGEDERQPGNKVLPVETFRTERWTAIDADVNFKAAQITRNKDLPIQNLETQIHMKDGVLSLTPMNFDIAGGRFTSNVMLDGSGKINPHAIRAELKAGARHLQLKKLFPTIDGMQATVGEVNADVSLSATGNSVASLLGSSNGELKGVVNEGSVSKLLLEAMGLNIGSVVLTKVVGDKQVKLNCMVTDFAVTNGLMKSRLFVVDTSEARIDINGTVNLGNEKLDLTLKPDAKSMRVISLRAPIYVRGTFKEPDLSIDKGALALRAGGALALAVVAPVAAIVPLVSTGPGETAGCQTLMAQAGGKPVAPPPGKPSH